MANNPYDVLYPNKQKTDTGPGPITTEQAIKAYSTPSSSTAASTTGTGTGSTYKMLPGQQEYLDRFLSDYKGTGKSIYNVDPQTDLSGVNSNLYNTDMSYANQQQALLEGYRTGNFKLGQSQKQQHQGAYTQHEMLMKYLPQQLNAQGLGGLGISQTALQQGQNNYANQLAGIDRNIGNRAVSLEEWYNAGRADVDKWHADKTEAVQNAEADWALNNFNAAAQYATTTAAANSLLEYYKSRVSPSTYAKMEDTIASLINADFYKDADAEAAAKESSEAFIASLDSRKADDNVGQIIKGDIKTRPGDYYVGQTLTDAKGHEWEFVKFYERDGLLPKRKEGLATYSVITVNALKIGDGNIIKGTDGNYYVAINRNNWIQVKPKK